MKLIEIVELFFAIAGVAAICYSAFFAKAKVAVIDWEAKIKAYVAVEGQKTKSVELHVRDFVDTIKSAF